MPADPQRPLDQLEGRFHSKTLVNEPTEPRISRTPHVEALKPATSAELHAIAELSARRD